MKIFGKTLLFVCLGSGLLILLRLEGFICVIMAAGIIFLPALLGMLIGYWIRNANKITILLALVLLNSSAIHYDFNDDSSVNTTSSISILIDASEEKIWQVMQDKVAFDSSNHFLLKAGISYPYSMQLKKSSTNKDILFCETNNGHAQLDIIELVKNKKLVFSIPKDVIHMEELTFYDHIHAPHLDGYFNPHHGAFTIEPISNNTCKLIAETSYSYKITPTFYWQWWTDYIVNTMHKHVLQKIKEHAE